MMITAPRQVGTTIRRKRKMLGMTQRNLAREAGVSERLIASLEAGDAPGVRFDKLLPVLGTLNLALEVIDEAEESAAKDEKSARLDAEYARAFAAFEEQLKVSNKGTSTKAQAEAGTQDVR